MTRRIDLTGQRFGRWEVLHYSHTNDAGTAYWECRCECGHQKPIPTAGLRSGRTRGCLECSSTARRIDLLGQRFGKWRVIRRVGSDGYGNTLWLCHCDCGTKRNIVTQNLTKGYSTQCQDCANKNRRKGDR